MMCQLHLADGGKKALTLVEKKAATFAIEDALFAFRPYLTHLSPYLQSDVGGLQNRIVIDLVEEASPAEYYAMAAHLRATVCEIHRKSDDFALNAGFGLHMLHRKRRLHQTRNLMGSPARM